MRVVQFFFDGRCQDAMISFGDFCSAEGGSIYLQMIRHVNMDLLHGEVVRQIDRYRKAKGESPTSMQAIYDYLHEKQIDEAKGVKEYQSMYRNV